MFFLYTPDCLSNIFLLFLFSLLIFLNYHVFGSAGRYEVDGYVYNSEEEPKILMTGKWNESLSYQPCDLEGEPLPGSTMKEVKFSFLSFDSNPWSNATFFCLLFLS